MRAAAAVPDSRAFNGVGYAGPGVGHAFTAQIEECGLVIELGAFDSAEEAARRYDVYASLLHGTHAVLNYAPEEPDDEPGHASYAPAGRSKRSRADAGHAADEGAAQRLHNTRVSNRSTAGRWHSRARGASESEDGPSPRGGGRRSGARAPAYDDELIDDALAAVDQMRARALSADEAAALDAVAASGVRAHVAAVVDALERVLADIDQAEEPA